MIEYVALTAAILSIILGFAALLSQKKYLDAKTQKPTNIEVPIFGKMKTNYPSLIFVFLGFCLIFYLVNQYYQIEPVSWKISGIFQSDNPDIEWSASKLSVFPCDIIDADIDKDTGKFDLTLNIKKGVKFEDKYNGITYTDKYESVTIVPSQELLKLNRSDASSLLKTKTARMRVYKPLKLVIMKGE